MPQKEDFQNLIATNERRLQKLKEQQAKLGTSTPPEILTEIEDIEKELEKLQTELETLQAAPDDSPSQIQFVPTKLAKTLSRRQPFEPEMILIPAGDFLMGSDPSMDKDARDKELPQHRLYLPDYYISKTPVTNAQYAAFVQGTGYQLPEDWENMRPPEGKQDYPVVRVSWGDTVAYCK